MTHIEQMIKDMCPQGVEWKQLGEVLDYEQPTPYLVNDTNYDDSYPTPVLTAGQSFILGYTDEQTGIYKASKETPTIIFDDFTTSFHWVDFDFKVKSSAMKMLRSKKGANINFRFVYYAMQCIKFQATEHTRYWISKYSQFEIPIPPIEIQKKIVECLDKFSALAAELQAELQKRRTQYEYYRTRLLTPPQTISPEGSTDERNWKWKTLGEISLDCYAGATPSTSKKEYWENGTIPWMSSGEVHLGQVCDVEKRITELGFKNSSTKWVPENSVVVALAGQGKTRGCVAITRIRLCTNQSLCAIIPNTDIILPEYLYQYLKTQYQKLREVSAGDGTRGGLNLKMIRSFPIVIPTLEEQKRIVFLLDKYEKLTNSLTDGIPAEQAAQQKRYEYYRDLLLTFDRC